ncbi:MAG: DUF1559 domain-containing protein [Planctomycetaceae bacterium]|nr:DUF1559 domain-containing protein [Planctomycetaceae bacterium]
MTLFSRSALCVLTLLMLIGCSSEPESPSQTQSANTPAPNSEQPVVPKETAAINQVENSQSESKPTENMVVTGKVEIQGDAMTLTVGESPEEMNVIGAGMNVSLSEEGELQVGEWRSPDNSVKPELEKEYFIITMGREAPGYLLKGQFKELPTEGVATLKIEVKLEELQEKTPIVVMRPKAATDEFMKRFQGIVKFNDPKKEDWSENSAIDMARLQAQITQSRNNLKQIALAFHMYNDVHGCLPPGVIYGPDGKPWHSWRTLILPYLEMQNMYEMYDVTQPWDSEANKKLAVMIMPVYSDPLRGENPENYTHYLSAIGKDAVLNGVEFDGTKAGFEAVLNQGTRFQDISDGSSSTLLVSTVSSDQKIRWTEPRDVFTNKNIPELNSKDGFSTYTINGTERLMVALCDGSVQTFEEPILGQKFIESLVTAQGGETPEETPLATRPVTYFTITADGENSTAVLKRVWE